MTDGHPDQAVSEPALTPAMIQRAREGLAAGQDRAVRRSLAEAKAQLAAIRQGHPPTRISGTWRRRVLRTFISSLFAIEVQGLEHIPHQPAILAANHLNHLDPFLILAIVPAQPYYYILGDARTLYNQVWKRWILDSAGGVIPLERRWKEETAVIAAAIADRPDLQPLAAAITADIPTGSDLKTLRQIDQTVGQILGSGDGILLFPEGRLGDREGQLQTPLRRGAILYAFRNRVPIIPIGLTGSQDVYWRKPLTIRFGAPIHLAAVQRPSRSQVDDAVAQLHQAIAQLLTPDYQEPTGIKLFRHQLNHLFW